MKVLDLYTPMQESLRQNLVGYEFFAQNPQFQFLTSLAGDWNMDQDSINAWLLSPQGLSKKGSAKDYLKIVHQIVEKIENTFEQKLPGQLVLMPSFGDFDGFARYDLGSHLVLLGIDFPDADVDYLTALTAHELSHVYRDHSEAVWSHLGKPLAQVTRSEYLEAGTAQEHLVSEGLATLFSQALFPEIQPHIHHYYEHAEWEWCLKNNETIESALNACLRSDEDVWSFYGSNRAGKGSPSRTQYFWAAQKIKMMVQSQMGGDQVKFMDILLELHRAPTDRFPIFKA